MADIFTEAESLKRRRALLEALSQQALQSPIVGRGYGLGQALAKMGTIALAGRGQRDLDEAESRNRADYTSALTSELQNYLKTSQGAPGQVMDDRMAHNLMVNDQAPPPLTEPVKADPREAIVQAMASRFPEMRSVGAAGLQEMLRPPKPDEWSVQFAPDGTMIRFSKAGKMEVGQRFGKPEEKWSDPYLGTVDGKAVLLRRNLTTNKVEQVGSGPGVSVNVGGENAGEKAVFTGTVEQVLPKGKSYEGAVSADQNLRLTTEALGALKAGGDAGFAGTAIQYLRKAGERFGVENAATAPTDTLSSTLKQRVFAKLGGLGVAISDADRRFMAEASGDLSTDSQALRRLMALDTAASILEISRHNRRVDELAKRGGAFELLQANRLPINFIAPDEEFAKMVDNVLAGKPTVDAPSSKAKPAAKPKTVQELLRERGLDKGR